MCTFQRAPRSPTACLGVENEGIRNVEVSTLHSPTACLGVGNVGIRNFRVSTHHTPPPVFVGQRICGLRNSPQCCGLICMHVCESRHLYFKENKEKPNVPEFVVGSGARLRGGKVLGTQLALSDSKCCCGRKHAFCCVC